MFSNLIVGNEKAVIGGLVAGVLAILGQLGVNGQMTLKEAVYAVITWAVTHVVVYSTTNTPQTATGSTTVVQPTVTVDLKSTQIPVTTPLHPDVTPIGSVPGN